ncbi:MAG: hypothetical protein J6X31_10605, partial [Bacteroidales bacterium]|nr:hypothetical protein [Bacteroidales bacterium]
TTENGVHGWKFTADNGNTLFLPAAGFKVNMTLFSPDSYGQYWSSQLDYSYPCNARYFGFNENTPHMNNSLGSDNRSTGRPIRAVRPAE